MNDAGQREPANRIECPATKDPAVRLFIVAGLLIGLGAWCIHDQSKYPYPQPYELNKYLSYAFNYYGPFVFIPVGLVFVVLAIVALRRRLVADEEGIGYQGKPKHAWAEITAVDASRLKDKGVLTLLLAGDKKLLLDCWKLKGFRELVAFVERRLPPDVRIGS